MKNTQNSSTRGVGWVGHEAGILWGGWVGSNMGCRYKVAPVQQDGTQGKSQQAGSQGQNATHRCHQNKANFVTDGRKNAATRGGHSAL